MKQLFLLIGLLLLCAPGYGQLDTARLSSAVERAFRQSPVRGVAVGVVDADGVRFTKTHGRSAEGTLTADSPLWLGSVSKTLTALAVCVLADRGELRLEQTVDEVLGGDFAFPAGGRITVRELLHHHSGLSQRSGYSEAVEYAGDFSALEPVVAPGSEGIYSSTNYALLGRIIERVSGRSYGAFMREEIFEPLGMDATSVPTPAEGRASVGFCLAYGLPLAARQMTYGPYIIPAGYILTTLRDVNAYAQFLLGDGSLPEADGQLRLLSAATMQSIFTPYRGTDRGYGKAWGIGTVGGARAYTHEGMTRISNAQITILPEAGLAISVLANTNSGPFFSIASETTEEIVAIVHGGEGGGSGWWEYLIRVALGLLTLKIFYDLFVYLRKWSRAGYPTRPVFRARGIPQYVFDVFPLLVLLFLPRLLEVPLSMLLRIMPDIGWAILLGGIVSVFHLYFRLVLTEGAPQKVEA